VRLANGFLPGHAGAEHALGGVGIDVGGMLIYAEIATERGKGDDQALLVELLARLRCSRVLLLDRPIGAAIGGVRDLGGHPVQLTRQSLRLVRGQGPGARRIFEDTPIVHPDVWYPLQSRRVRYFKKHKPRSED
jgi:hypothetical protein